MPQTANNALVTDLIGRIERVAAERPDACAVRDESGRTSYCELVQMARRAGSALMRAGAGRGRGVVVVADKSAETLAVMLGALYAGSFYVPLAPPFSPLRLRRVLEVLDAPVVATDGGEAEALADAGVADGALALADLVAGAEDAGALAAAREAATDADPAYIMFTSGSTGAPKGVVVSRRSVADFVGVFVDTFGIRPTDVVANQAPFDFDVSVKDIYGALFAGTELALVPRRLFSAPAELVDYLVGCGATVMTWAVAALCLVTSLHALEGRELPQVRLVLFSGEVMPLDHLRAWMDRLPQATFVNLYGPTEVTCNCSYHVIERGRDYTGGIPIGRAFRNREVLLVADDGTRATEPGQLGEIVVRGSGLASGYVGAGAADDARFCQNPLSALPDRVYRTGDYGRVTESGEVLFAGRRDNQIKHQGHRIELEEIDAAMELCPAITRCRCAYNAERHRLVAFFEGDADARGARTHAHSVLPAALAPTKFVRVDTMPLTKNGKVDRRALLQSLEK